MRNHTISDRTITILTILFFGSAVLLAFAEPYKRSVARAELKSAPAGLWAPRREPPLVNSKLRSKSGMFRPKARIRTIPR